MNNLKQRRFKLRLSQAKLAKLACVSEMTISRIENGRPAHASTLKLLEDALENFRLEMVNNLTF